ncbi:MAG TPA: glucoamylase family protein, partial [Flavisolibacter sp.]|nr:glucoamylase family protein [Flavisolibacter sp.]
MTNKGCIKKRNGLDFPTKVLLFAFGLAFTQCSKSPSSNTQPTPPPPPSSSFDVTAKTINGAAFTLTQTLRGINIAPAIRTSFSDKVDRSTVLPAITFTNKSQGSANVPFVVSYQNNDSTVVITPSASLPYLNEFIFSLTNSVKSTSGKNLSSRIDLDFMTGIDSSDKFPTITDSALVQLVQQQTFKYFWDFGHPVSGLARERNTSGDIVTSGGSGFGAMAILVGIQRGFISRSQGLARLQTMVSFLKNTAQRFHGAYPHWLNGATGAVVPFSTKDNGADLVETSYLLQGLLCARQYFNSGDAAELSLRADINAIWQGVEWTWFRNSNENVLYWHWSPNYFWDINMQIKGWNEALITYVLAASSPSYSIPKIVYDNGWASNGSIRNGATYFGYQLPLGPNLGGPLFFEHYSFLSINPFGLADAYANYQTQA